MGNVFPRDPHGNKQDMHADIGETAYEGGHPVAELFAMCPLGEEFLLMFGNQVDVLLQMTLQRKHPVCSGAWFGIPCID